MRAPRPPKNTCWLFLWLVPPVAAALILSATALIGWGAGAWAPGALPDLSTYAGAAVVGFGTVFALSALCFFVGARQYREEWRAYEQQRRFFETGAAELLRTRRQMHQEVRRELAGFLAGQRSRARAAVTQGVTEGQRHFAAELQRRFGLAAQVLRLFRERSVFLHEQLSAVARHVDERQREKVARVEAELAGLRGQINREVAGLLADGARGQAELRAGQARLAGDLDDLRRKAVLADEDFTLPAAIQDRLHDRVGRVFDDLAADYAPDVMTLDHQRTLGLIEKRLAKLAQAVDRAEGRIDLLAERGATDGGVPSIYRGVQGLAAGDARFQEKSDVLKKIFEMNLALQKKPVAAAA